MGVLYNAAGGTFVDQQDASADTITGAIKVALLSPAGLRMDTIGANVDGVAGTRYLGVGPAYFNGSTYDRSRVQTVVKDIAATAITAGTAATVWTPTAGKKFRLMGWCLSSSAVASIIFRYGATPTTMFRTELLAAAGLSYCPSNFGNGIMPGGINEVLKLDVTATSTVSGYVFGTEE